MTEELRHLSPSKIETAMKCPEQFRLRYIEKIPEMSIMSMLSGRVIHAINEHYLKAVANGKAAPSAKDLDDLFLKEWEDQTKEEEEKAGFIGWSVDPDEPVEKIYSESRTMIQFVHAEVLPKVKPMMLNGEPGVEYTVKDKYETEDGDSFLVWMVIDLMEEDGTITDWKTTGKVSKNATKSWFQMAAYSTFGARVMKVETVNARKIFLVLGKRPKVEVVNYLMGPSHREWFKRQAVATWKMAKAGAFVAGPNGWWCAQDWCSFYAMCQGEMS